jgi:hypothetical protein
MIDFKTIIEMCWSKSLTGNKETAPDEVYIDSLHKEIVNRKKQEFQSIRLCFVITKLFMYKEKAKTKA